MPKMPPFMIILLIALISSSCLHYRLATSDLKDPTFTYQDYNLKEISAEDIRLEFYFDAYNANDIGLRNIFVNYEFFVEGNPFFKGKEIPLELAPEGKTKITIPAQFAYKDFFNALFPIARRIIVDQYKVPVTVKALVYGSPTLYDKHGTENLFSFKIQLKKTEQIQLPEKAIKQFKDKAKNNLKGVIQDLF